MGEKFYKVYRVHPDTGERLFLDNWWSEPTYENLKDVYGLGMYECWPGEGKIIDVSLMPKIKEPPVRKLELDD